VELVKKSTAESTGIIVERNPLYGDVLVG